MITKVYKEPLTLRCYQISIFDWYYNFDIHGWFFEIITDVDY